MGISIVSYRENQTNIYRNRNIVIYNFVLDNFIKFSTYCTFKFYTFLVSRYYIDLDKKKNDLTNLKNCISKGI